MNRGWWNTWGSLLQRLLAMIASWATLVGLVLVFAPQPVKFEGVPLYLVLVSSVLALVTVFLEIKAEIEVKKRSTRKEYKLTDKSGITTYMRSWIQQAGQAAIWTRDLSWSGDSEVKHLLLAKAAGGSLVLCLPRMNEIAMQLKEAGATVYIYDGDAPVSFPASRFTVAYFGNGGSKVAIGRVDGDLHIIDELDQRSPAYAMASDLIEMAKLVAKGT